MIDELEPLQNHPENERRFVKGKLPADTGPLSVPERFISIVGYFFGSSNRSGRNCSASSPKPPCPDAASAG